MHSILQTQQYVRQSDQLYLGLADILTATILVNFSPTFVSQLLGYFVVLGNYLLPLG